MCVLYIIFSSISESYLHDPSFYRNNFFREEIQAYKNKAFKLYFQDPLIFFENTDTKLVKFE